MNAQADPRLQVSRLILGIESSCDDTAASVIAIAPEAPFETTVLSSVVVGQDAAHAPYGGVVPEIAARAHAQRLPDVVDQALSQAGTALSQIDAIAATAGPGLIGGVMSGLTFAKGLSLGTGCPLVPVNHLAGHALSVGLEAAISFPYLLLLVSGGHTQLLRVEGTGRFCRLGTTIDDAAGEAFDKTAKLMGLKGAGGPAIERLAKSGDAARFEMPRPLLGRAGADFSFSGMKTAIRQHAEAAAPLDEEARADLAASFQAAAVAHLLRQTEKALHPRDDDKGIGNGEGAGASVDLTALVAAGGVAANGPLREGLRTLAVDAGVPLILPSLTYCTDNAAMIAYAGARAWFDDPAAAVDGALSTVPRARWPLDEREAAVTLGAGRKGRKA